jgi:hypothetical protein
MPSDSREKREVREKREARAIRQKTRTPLSLHPRSNAADQCAVATMLGETIRRAEREVRRGTARFSGCVCFFFRCFYSRGYMSTRITHLSSLRRMSRPHGYERWM